MTELLLGCGFARKKLLGLPGRPLEWAGLVTCDVNAKCSPDILCDLDPPDSRYAADFDWEIEKVSESAVALTVAEDEQIFFRENMFEEVHAYEVLEHLGQQGFTKSFFCTFYNIHRILKPGGHLFATVPSRFSAWLWGDPSHRRVICAESLAFLSQDVIAKNRAMGAAMSDFSTLWDRDFKVLSAQDNHTNFIFCLQAIK
jgi:predicted SAM-dependent methyltransferase